MEGQYATQLDESPRDAMPQSYYPSPQPPPPPLSLSPQGTQENPSPFPFSLPPPTDYPITSPPPFPSLQYPVSIPSHLPQIGEVAQAYEYDDPSQHETTGRTPEQGGERFPVLSEYRDLIWSILFGIHILVTITIFAITVSNYNHFFSGSSSSSAPAALSKSRTRGLKFSIAIVSIVSVVLVGIWTLLLRKISGWVVYLSVIFAIASYIGVGVCLVLTLTDFLWPFGVGILIFAIFNIVFYFYNRQKLKFAGHVLSCVAEIIKVFPATILLSFFSILPLVGWGFFWASAFTKAVLLVQPVLWRVFILTYLIFSHYWTTQVIKGLVNITAAGVFSSWYFLAPNVPRYTTWRSFKRGKKTLCLGLLLNRIFSRIFQLFNRYAFTQVAIYGTTFCESAKATCALFAKHGFDLIVNEDLTGLVLTTACVISGLLAASTGVLFCFLYFHHAEDQIAFSVVVGGIGFFLGYTFTGLFMEIVDAGVATLFVCFVYEPERLRESSPTFYEKFVEAYGGKCKLFQDQEMH